MSLNLGYSWFFALHCMILYVLIKVLVVMLPIINRAKPWISETIFRQQMKRHRNLGLEPFVEVNYLPFSTEILILLSKLWIAEQFALAYLLLHMRRWNDILLQIIIFHQENDVPKPNITAAILKHPDSSIIWILYFIVVNVGLVGTLYMTEQLIEWWRLSLPEYIDLTTIVIIITSLIVWPMLVCYMTTDCAKGVNEVIEFLDFKNLAPLFKKILT